MPNPWDAGSAKLLASLGFDRAGHHQQRLAATLGRLDGGVSRDEALAHAEAIVGATDVPVSADLENCYADDPAGVAETIRGAVATGLAGCSVEDFTHDHDDPVYELAAGHGAGRGGRGGGALWSRPLRPDRPSRRTSSVAGVTWPTRSPGCRPTKGPERTSCWPGVSDLDEIRQLVAAVDLPVNVLAMPGGPSVAQLGSAGVKRISVGGAFAYARVRCRRRGRHASCRSRGPTATGAWPAAVPPRYAPRSHAEARRMRVEQAIVFAEREGFRALELDVYRPEPLGSDARALVVYIHGGGWRVSHRSRAPRETRPWDPGFFERLTTAGFVVAAPDYRFSGEARFPAQVDDVIEALCWLQAQADALGIDSRRTYLWGCSAGGAVAAMAALVDGAPTIAGAVCAYAITDLLALDHEATDTFEAHLLGGAIGEHQELADQPARCRTSTPTPRRSCSSTATVTPGYRAIRASAWPTRCERSVRPRAT